MIKTKESASAKRDMGVNAVISVRRVGMTILTASHANVQAKAQRRRTVFATKSVGSVLAKQPLVDESATSALRATMITLIASLVSVTVWGLMGCLATIMEFVFVRRILWGRSVMIALQKDSIIRCVKNVAVTLMVSPNTSSLMEVVPQYQREISANVKTL